METLLDVIEPRDPALGEERVRTDETASSDAVATSWRESAPPIPATSEDSEAASLIGRYFCDLHRFSLLGDEAERDLADTLYEALETLLMQVPGGEQSTVTIRDVLALLAEAGPVLDGRSRVALKTVENCRRRVIESNLRLAVHIARGQQDRGLPLPDLIQEGNIGLMKAVERFDPSRGFKFCTYAYWWIAEEISRAIKRGRAVVRTPDHVVDEIRRMQAVAGRLTRTQGRTPSREALAAAVDSTPERIDQLTRFARPEVSTATPISAEGELTLSDTLVDPDSEPVEASLKTRDQQRLVDEALSSLKPREAEILARRFGVGGGAPETLQMISEDMNISRERVRQIEKTAMKKLRERSANLAHLGGN